MNLATQTSQPKLPSLDWLAFGLAIACTALASFVHQLMVLVPVAVFLPSLLREFGVLHDADEFTNQVMHRAGFHALLTTALLVFACYALARPIDPWLSPDLLTGETLRKVLLYTFVVSYLLQYWGAREGAFRLLLGMAVWTALTLVDLASHPDRYTMLAGIALTILALIATQIGLAFVVRRWPRAGGLILLAIFGALVICGLSQLDELGNFSSVALPSILLQASIIPGATGLALVRSKG